MYLSKDKWKVKFTGLPQTYIFLITKNILNNKIDHLCKTLAIPKSPNLTIPFFVKNMFYKIQKHKYYTDAAITVTKF